MDCARVDDELVGFQLAALDGATRAAVEAHLTGCARCVSSYLALKRAIDAAEDAAAPSELVKARIRAEAHAQLAKTAAATTTAAAAATTTTATAKTAAATTTAAAGPATATATARPRRARWAIAATAAAAAFVLLGGPLVYRAVHPPAAAAPGMSAPQVPAPEVVPVNLRTNETVDTARVTPGNLAFL